MLQIISGETARLSYNHKIDKKIERIARDCYKAISSGNSHFLFKNRIVFANPHDIFRVLSEIRTENIMERDALLRTLYNAEKRHAGSAFVLLCLISNKQLELRSFGKFSRSFLKKIVEESKIEVLQQAFFDAIMSGGSNCIIKKEKTDKQTHLVCSSGLVFPISQIKEFGDSLSFSSCHFLLFDGIIERVSQIERIIDFQMKNNSNFVLLCRGYSYEVVSTLLHNLRIKRLKIFPITTNSDWSSEFIMRDLSECLGTNREIIDTESIREIKNVKIFDSCLSIEDPELLEKVSELSRKISKDFENPQILKEVVEKRLGFLSSRRLEVFVGKEYGESSDVILDRIDYVSRLIISSRAGGCVTILASGTEHTVPLLSIKNAVFALKSMEKTLFLSKKVRNVA